jgi:hypothetical protein
MANDSTIKGSDDARIRWLDPVDVRLFRDASGSLHATVSGSRSVVRPALLRAFPVTDPANFIELREEGGASVGMLKSLGRLDEASRGLAEEMLRERYMVPTVNEIRSIRQEFGVWVWEVRTDRGEKTFSIRSPRDDIRPLPASAEDGHRVRRIRITDTDGNMYEIRDYAALDGHSKSVFDTIA